MPRNASFHSYSIQQLQVAELNLRIREFLRQRRLKMNGITSLANDTVEVIRKSEGILFPLGREAARKVTENAEEQSALWTVIPLSALIIMSILFFCYILPYLSWRFKGPLTNGCCMSEPRSCTNTVSLNPSTQDTTVGGEKKGWWFEQFRWIRRERNVPIITRKRDSSVRFSTRLRKITYTSNGETHFQEIRCEGDDIAEEISIHIPESDNDDQETIVYGDLGRPKTFSDASACSHEIPQVIIHKVPRSDSHHLHPNRRTMSTRSHESRKKVVRPTTLLCSTTSNPLPLPAVDVRTAWSDPNLASVV